MRGARPHIIINRLIEKDKRIREKSPLWEGVVQFYITDKKDEFYLTFEHGRLSLNDGVHEKPSLIVRSTDDFIYKAVALEEDAFSAYVDSKIKIEGPSFDAIEFLRTVLTPAEIVGYSVPTMRTKKGIREKIENYSELLREAKIKGQEFKLISLKSAIDALNWVLCGEKRQLTRPSERMA